MTTTPAREHVDVLRDLLLDSQSALARFDGYGGKSEKARLERNVAAYSAAVEALTARPVGVDDSTIDRMCRVVASNAGEDFDALDPFTKDILRNTQRAALEAAALSAPVADHSELIERLKVAGRALVRERKIYFEDIETLLDVTKLLELLSSPVAGASVGIDWRFNYRMAIATLNEERGMGYQDAYADADRHVAEMEGVDDRFAAHEAAAPPAGGEVKCDCPRHEGQHIYPCTNPPPPFPTASTGDESDEPNDYRREHDYHDRER